jgi:hypothetical protein
MLFQAEMCQWQVKVIGARKVFQGKMPLIPIRLKRVNTYIRKKPTVDTQNLRVKE